MKTKELIKGLGSIMVDFSLDEKQDDVVEEVIERLEGLEDVKDTMKTEELIVELNDIRIDHSLSENHEYVVDEIIKRLEELEELRRIIANEHYTQDHTMKRLLRLVTNIVKE